MSTALPQEAGTIGPVISLEEVPMVRREHWESYDIWPWTSECRSRSWPAGLRSRTTGAEGTDCERSP